MAGFCMTAGVLCLLYYLALLIFTGITSDFAWIWLAASAVLGGLGTGIRYEKVHPGFFPGWLKYAVIVALLAGLVLFLFIFGRVVRGMARKGSEGLSYIVVLGAQVKKDVPSRALRMRLEKALEYANANEQTILILSGGKGSGEEISEAECMMEYLLEHGISGERLILEDQSTNTMENLKFSNALTDCADAATGILTSNFHVYRAVRLAEKQGYGNCEGIAAKTDIYMLPHYMVREVFALVKEKLQGNL